MIGQSNEDETPENNNVWLGAKDALAKVTKSGQRRREFGESWAKEEREVEGECTSAKREREVVCDPGRSTSGVREACFG